MQTNDYPVHHTFTNRIPDSEGGGWEFWCVECSYRVRYTQQDASSSQQLQVLNAGDPLARHTSNQASMEQLTDEFGPPAPQNDAFIPPDDRYPLHEDFDEERWLNPEIRVFLAHLLDQLDL
jgi:hypothetical protein